MYRVLVILAGSMIVPQAVASSFSYSYIEPALGIMALEQDLRVGDEVYEELAMSSFEGAYQVNGGFAVKANSTFATNDGPDTQLNISELFVGGAFPLAIGDRADIAPEIGYAALETETCIDDVCRREDEAGLRYGLAVRTWAVPGDVEISLGWADSTLDESESRVNVGGAFWWLDAHSIRLDASVQDDLTRATVGYRYTWR